MSQVTMKQLLESGVHFGHQTRRWNPKMKRYIFGERGGIYIIDLQQTIVLLERAQDVCRAIAERGGTVMFVGTKKQTQDAVRSQALRCGMPFVSHRWLGGLLTNWGTMALRVKQLHALRVQQRELPVGLVAFEVVQPADALADGLEVGQQAAEPAVVDERHVG